MTSHRPFDPSFIVVAIAAFFAGCTPAAPADAPPAPAHCPGVAKQIRAEAAFKMLDGKKVIEVDLTLPADRADVKLTGAATATGSSTLVMSKPEGSKVMLVFAEPGIEYASLGASVPISCTAGPGTVAVDVELVPNAPLQLALRDR